MMKKRPLMYGTDVTIEDAFSSNHLHTLRKNLLNGIKVSDCQRCWDMEKLKGQSKRQDINQYFNDESIHKMIDNPVLDNIKISFGNKCNLRCMMCSPGFSDQIGREEGIENPVIYHGSLYNDIIKISENLRSIEVMGGETPPS